MEEEEVDKCSFISLPLLKGFLDTEGKRGQS